MSQIKIYGLKSSLDPIKAKLSDTIHSCVMDALQFPADKRAHRFIGLEIDDFFMPAGRSDSYIIIEITMIEGRSVDAKKKLIRLLFDRIKAEIGIDCMDVEICIYESPACNWGFRGMHGDEIKLNYSINV
ncbi:tautomerase family protein [Cellvibrio sp.]|uniref:tautomerase family protein n=1 Tax=Cellvibrio sp. TaxID=1965322 RepID=UPI0039647DAD